jgi:DNA (cytosine-5)-methyltransferase 1
MLRAIREIQPRWIVGENVLGLVNWNGGMVFEEVQADLEAEGYEVQPYVLPAAAVGAPHRRDRVWFVAYAKSMGRRRRWCETSKQWKDNIWESRCEGFGGSGISTNPSSDGFNAKPSTTNNIIGQDNIESGTQRERAIKGLSNEWNATNPNGNGQQQCDSQYEINASKGRVNALNVFNETTMHTNRTSKQGEHIGQKREGKFNGPDSGDGFDNFQNFPTQSPICSGDDGLPTQLDGITFSKWRAESIKGYGNAIVPQIAYSLFQIINEL